MNRTETYQVPKGKTKSGITKKESQPLATAPRPLPKGELVVSFYDSTKTLLSTEILSLKSENEWETLSFSTKAEEKGFVSASIRGTSTEPVKFDDFSIQLKSLYSAKLYQENHYYPFGMNMKGLESSDKQTRQNKKEHKFQFNAQTEREESFGLYWDETPFRPMDSQIGRFWGVDLLAEAFVGITPFHYAYNNPIRFNDPTGLAGESAGFTYDWDSNQYLDANGEAVFWDVVHISLQDNGKTQSLDFEVTDNGINMFKPIGLYNEAEGKSHNQIINVPMGGGCCPGGDDEDEDDGNWFSDFGDFLLEPASDTEVGMAAMAVSATNPMLGLEIDRQRGSMSRLTAWAYYLGAAAETMAENRRGGAGRLNAKPGRKLLSQFSSSRIDDGVSITMRQKRMHIFHGRIHPKPYLNDLATQLGGERNVIRAALQNANGRFPTSGIFELPVNVGGRNLTIRGFVKDGNPIINTMY